MSRALYALPPIVAESYTDTRYIDRLGWCGVHALLFHWTMHYGIDGFSYEGRYCFKTREGAVAAMNAWTGEGDPPGDWHKHPPTGRRRDPATGEIWDEGEYRR